jgi:hypothetical protein
MNVLKTRLLKTAVALAALAILVMVTPRAVRSAASALVQVTNTFSNPAITQPVPTAASQMVTLVNYGYPRGFPLPGWLGLFQFSPSDGTVSSNHYVVPAGQNLVITDVELGPDSEWTYSTGPNAMGIQLYTFSNSAGLNQVDQFVAPATGAQFRFASGIVFPAGQEPAIMGYNLPVVILRGYLTAN